MQQKEVRFEYDIYDSIQALDKADANLLEQARKNTASAYAPYSEFKVGAAALLANGEMVNGSNQENASTPVGLCAERVLLSAISSLFPDTAIQTMAISFHNMKGASDHPISPCGICRQTILEYQIRLKHPIRLILSGMEGEVYILPDAAQLLPLSFTSNDMK
ncbi:MAG: cytidine deaminase [Sediminibacterium sp.]|nr:cytidine deaminase [Sediminibacterium sp.]